ncbi:hypothetical protein VFPPC_17985 [Pochonia chlamydosporia 170]|uniref:Uncharacterized protein n=1 Tax=Pochonia chlamydosporia 170 TaxID=1380566 RepID=A0A219AQG5_METCM|nr:hypothetical protein VFPPC_17985 [Pochonia chlamydosporia 170]OWT42822.1 hypothetical protein VFPPC_17985 [Pochonia chlamydosporia 170]
MLAKTLDHYNLFGHRRIDVLKKTQWWNIALLPVSGTGRAASQAINKPTYGLWPFDTVLSTPPGTSLGGIEDAFRRG